MEAPFRRSSHSQPRPLFSVPVTIQQTPQWTESEKYRRQYQYQAQQSDWNSTPRYLARSYPYPYPYPYPVGPKGVDCLDRERQFSEYQFPP